MKKNIGVLVILLSIVLPSVASAAWWNDFSWLNWFSKFFMKSEKVLISTSTNNIINNPIVEKKVATTTKPKSTVVIKKTPQITPTTTSTSISNPASTSSQEITTTTISSATSTISNEIISTTSASLPNFQIDRISPTATLVNHTVTIYGVNFDRSILVLLSMVGAEETKVIVVPKSIRPSAIDFTIPITFGSQSNQQISGKVNVQIFASGGTRYSNSIVLNVGN